MNLTDVVKGLRFSRSLRTTLVLASLYGGCSKDDELADACTNDSQCNNDRVCEYNSIERRYRCMDAKGNGGNHSLEPTYSGMCNDYADASTLSHLSSSDVEDLRQLCLEDCEPIVRNRLWCASVYCVVEVFDPKIHLTTERVHDDPLYKQCLRDFGIEPPSK